MSLAELKRKIKQKAKTGKTITEAVCLNDDEWRKLLVLNSNEQIISALEKIHDSTEWIKVSDVLALLDEKFEKAVTKATMTHASKAWEEMRKTHVIIDREKLRKLLDEKPETIYPPHSRKPWCNPYKSAEFLEKLEKELEQ